MYQSFKAIMLVVALGMPWVAGATTTSFSNVSTGTGNSDGARINTTSGTRVGSGSFTGTGFAVVDMRTENPFADLWTLVVSPGELAQIKFADISPGANSIENFLSSSTPSLTPTTIVTGGDITYTFSGITAGTYNFNVGGNSSTPDQYRVNTTVSAVPIPAAIWLMGSAIMGLVGFGKRKAGLAA